MSSYYDLIFGDSNDVEEVQPTIRYRDNTVSLDLNTTPLEDPYAQQYPRQPDYYCYSGQSSFDLQSYPNYAYNGEERSVRQDYPDQGDVGGEAVYPDNEGCYPVILSFETDRTFASREELTKWVQETGQEKGYVLVIKRSKKRGNNFVKVVFQCSLGGEYKSVATVRKTGSKKIGCPFELIGVVEPQRQVWRLKVKNPAHNHTPFENLEGHAYARRLSSDDKELVGQMLEQDIPNRTIWRTLTKKNPERKLIPKDINNACQKINVEKGVSYDPMQQLENFLVEKHFTYYTRENDTTNAVEDIFFVHKHSFTMWCAFPHVLMIDATYNTNMYNMAFVQVAGMASTNQSFAVAHAFVAAEKVDNYLWVLEKIKSMLVDCMEPRVIVTDRDLALMSACERVFPNAYKFLCRFHIQQNIARNSKKAFTDNEWKQFLRSFSTLCESPTEALYEYNLANFQSHLEDIGRTREYFLHNYVTTFFTYVT